MPRIVLAVDPGLPITIAVLHGDGELTFYEQHQVATQTGKAWTNDPSKIVKAISKYSLQADLVIEHVAIWPGEDVRVGAAFVGSMHLVIGICAALRVPYTMVTPAVWKRKLGVPGKREVGAARKVVDMAAAAYPKAKALLGRAKDHNRADAALLGLWYSQRHEL